MKFQRIIAELADQPRQRALDHFAGRVVALWHSRIARDVEPVFAPTIRAALRAGLPVLSYKCPACGMIGDTDIRTFDRHPGASLESLVPLLSCVRCPDGPHAKIVGLRGFMGR